MRHQHAEAFNIMAYRCDLCAVTELVWNSRDGVTPFCIGCSSCGAGEANHANWGLDVYAPDHRPLKGQRYFRDGLRAEARAIMRARLEKGRDTSYEVPEDEWPAFIDECLSDDEHGEFQRGWPMLVVAGTDADTLPA